MKNKNTPFVRPEYYGSMNKRGMNVKFMLRSIVSVFPRRNPHKRASALHLPKNSN